MEAKLFKSNWKQVWFLGWSSWFMWAAAILTGLEILLPLLWDQGLLDLPSYVYPVTMSVLVSCGLIARIMVQRGRW